MGFLIVTNPGAGSGDPDDVISRATERLPDVEIVELRPGVDLGEAVGQAVDRGRVVVAAGGDGTVNAVVQHLVGRGTLGVLPAGTLNHFARDLGVRDDDAALEALEAGETRSIDVGVAGSVYFVNNAGLGLYPEGVRERERSEHRFGKLVASLGASVRLLRTARPLMGTIEADGDRRVLFAWVVFAGNNRFGATPGSFVSRTRMDEGLLDVRVVTANLRSLSRAKAAWRLARGAPLRSRRLVRTQARRLVVRLEGQARPVSWDGEHGDPTNELEIRLIPQGLRVLAPPGI
jgi:diacylglycerol kinase family enzyme